VTRCFFRDLWRWTGAIVSLGCLAVVVVRAVTAPAPATPRALSEPERRALARTLAAQEPVWQARAAHKFPGDRWSQDDDFFNQEHFLVRSLAARHGTSPGELLLGIDAELRALPSGRKVTQSPLKPRPFYD
jgi:hypothetical protein